MKKLFLAFALLLSVFAIAACNTGTESDTTSRFDSKEEVFGFSILASAQGLNSLSTYSMNTSDGIMTMSQHDTFEILDEIEELRPYLTLVQTYLNEEEGFNVEVTESEYEAYEYKMTIFALNMVGEYTSYEIHYNEEITDEDEEGVEYESTLTGILLIDGVTYQLKGEREVEQGEESLELTASIDDDNYVTISYEMEIDDDEFETEFLLEIYKDGELVKYVEIEFEDEDGETELELNFYENGRESEYEFEIERDGNTTTIEIEYKITQDGNLVEEGEIDITIVYDEVAGEHTVTYSIEVYGKGSVIIEDDEMDDDDEDLDDEDLDDEDLDDEDLDDEEDDEEEATA